MAEQKDKGPRLGLYLTEKREGEYYHVRAGVVTIDDAGKIRNAGDELIRGLYLYDFEVGSQGDARSRERGTPDALYAWECRYTKSYTDSADARRMVKTFDLIERRMDALTAKVGRPLSFGQYLARVAGAIGADAMVWRKGKANGWSYDDTEHRIETLADGVSTVDGWVWQWCDEATRKEA